MQEPDGHSTNYAAKSCEYCKQRKRKCNKALPSCALCLKNRLVCNYVSPQPGTSLGLESTSEEYWTASPLERDSNAPSIDYPAILFLDPNLLLLQHGQLGATHTTSAVDQKVLELVGSLDQIKVAGHKYFECIHKWLPFLSKKRFFEVHFRPSFQTRPEVVLLFLAIKLITTVPYTGDDDTRTSYYRNTKHFYLEVENSAPLSILTLQAGILIALYELGHGIYPAAYLSIGACARYAYAIGINVKSTKIARKVFTFLEVEEQRRAWWAIVILDRFANIGCPGRPLATADPHMDDILPTDDAAWDQGIVRPEEFCTLSSPKPGHMSKFGLICQAASLLSQALQSNASLESTANDDGWIQLDRTIQSMLNASLEVDNLDYDHISFVYSTLTALHAPWLRAERLGEDNYRCQRAREAATQVLDRVNANMAEKRCLVGRNPEEMSFWGIFFAYQVMGFYMCSSSLGSDSIKVVKAMREAFHAINNRWKVAGIYLQLLEAQETLLRF